MTTAFDERDGFCESECVENDGFLLKPITIG
jgi:hypothetical protein